LFVGPELAEPTTELRPGLRLFGTGAHVPLPGSIYNDGRVVHWETSPDECVIEDLPCWLVPPAALQTATMPHVAVGEGAN
jgi:hypothetical protein